ncbi:Sodium-coupled monocarboxylate transporter 1 [Bulinus truncatus]|nr:Sodium-coupled monocarboxylate transporter 1 [Bulinus truncatus]
MVVGLQTLDYVVTAVMLFIPLAIGVYFAIKDVNKSTRDEYLLGGRQMTMLPVALSLFATFASAISLMGVPTEVYYTGAMHPTFQAGFAIAHLIGYFTMVPLIYPLQITSIFEYLRLRFRSNAVRNCSLLLAMLQTFFYMAIALLTPALGLQTAAGIPLWVSILIVGIIGTIYTAIGGIKSVVWTDAFQCCIMFVGLMMMICKGVLIVGGVDKVWNIAESGGRTNFVQFSPDPRSRLTWWGTIIGGCFMWLTNIFNQSSTQRICSMKTMKEAKMTYIINMFLFLIYGAFLFCVGIVIYSYFYHTKCDPFQAGFITNKNQLPPYFVLHVLQDLPGMAGIYMSSIFSGALSTLSSGMNALAANTVEDILKHPLRNLTEQTTTLITKIIVVIYGVLIIIVAYLAKNLSGSVAQMGLSVFGACGGPILGVFLLGASIPWGNKYGALVGGPVALSLTIWMSIGNQMYGRKVLQLPVPTTEMCFTNKSDYSSWWTEWTLFNETVIQNTSLVEQGHSDTSLFMYDVSYEWYGFIGAVVSFTVGVLVSRFTHPQPTPSKKLIFPILTRFWSFPKESLVTYEIPLENVLEYQLQVKA